MERPHRQHWRNFHSKKSRKKSSYSANSAPYHRIQIRKIAFNRGRNPTRLVVKRKIRVYIKIYFLYIYYIIFKNNVYFSFFCMATRLDTKQFFQDWDRRGRNKVTPKQFRQVFATVNFPVSDKEFDAICRQYYCPEQVYIRYVDFINDTNVIK